MSSEDNNISSVPAIESSLVEEKNLHSSDDENGNESNDNDAWETDEEDNENSNEETKDLDAYCYKRLGADEFGELQTADDYEEDENDTEHMNCYSGHLETDEALDIQIEGTRTRAVIVENENEAKRSTLKQLMEKDPSTRRFVVDATADSHISEEDMSIIQATMQKISFPAHAIPEWAKHIPEYEWLPQMPPIKRAGSGPVDR